MDVKKEIQGYNLEAESVVKSYAEGMRKFGLIMAVLSAIGSFVCACFFANSHMTSAFAPCFLFMGAISFFVWFKLGELIWATIMLFVNMSTTLKHIERQLEHTERNQQV